MKIVTDPELDAMAVVLTYNAPEALHRCLAAVAAQTLAPRAVLVVDNASTPPVDPADFPPGCPPVTLVHSDHNGGPAGGYAIALEEFLTTQHRHAWVLDDDMRPDPDCLERLWVVAAKDPERSFVFPVSFQPDGTFGAWPSWCGFLVAREIIDLVGLPMADLFWWAEDTEYLQWRIPQAGFPMRVVGDAKVHHEAIRQGHGVPVWKYYYEARNMLYLHLHVKKRVGYYPRNIAKLFGRAILREPEGRVVRLRAMGHGLYDGARGRLGTQFPIESMQERKT
jgi:GT2 family glycosyltransferase